MKFVCDRCQTKYSIADERVRGKILKVKCKSCTNIITVREAKRPSGAFAPLSDTGHDSERTVLAPNPALLSERIPVSGPVAVPPPAPAKRPTGTLAAVASPDDGVAWYMALAGERTGPFTRKQLVDKIAPLPKNADLHIWSEQLGAWKPPADVPAIAGELAARRKSPPSLPPGAPRRPTPSPPPPPVASLGDKLGPRSTGAHAVPGAHLSGAAPASPGIGLKLPPPTGGALPRPAIAASGAGRAAAAARLPDAGIDIDPSTMLETPAPQPHMLHSNGTNGASAHPPGIATRSSSDVLKLLNLPGAPQTASATADSSGAGPAPRLMSSAAVVGWTPSVEASADRSKKTKLIFAFLSVIAVTCVVVFLGLSKKRQLPPPPVAPPVSDPLAGVMDKMGAPEPPKPPEPPTVAQVPPPPPPVGAHGKKQKGRGGRAIIAATTTTTPTPTPPPPPDANSRYRDTGPGIKINPTAPAVRPPPSQAQITSVISNNKAGIKTCYQRALARDNSLTHGKITVRLTLGISGRVKSSNVDGPQQFRALEPCIKEVVARWVFPQASEEYGTEFPLVFQGNE